MYSSSPIHPTQTVSLPGKVSVAYTDLGSGTQTLLFIHGLAGFAPVWQKNIEALSRHHRCIAIDLPGNGYSDKNTHPFSIPFFTDVVYDFINHLSLKNVVLVGHSMGGQIVLNMLLQLPHIAHKAVLCAPAGFEPFSPIDKSIYYATSTMLDFFTSDEANLRSSLQNSFYSPSQLPVKELVEPLVNLIQSGKAGYYRQMIAACIKSMIEHQVYDKLHLIAQPILVLFGEQDAFIPNKVLHPQWNTRQIAETGIRKLPNARLHLLPKCGHFIQWEQHELVNRLITEWVA